MDSYILIIFHHPSRVAYKSGLRVVCDLAMIYKKASLYIYCKLINPHIIIFKNRFGESFKCDDTYQSTVHVLHQVESYNRRQADWHHALDEPLM